MCIKTIVRDLPTLKRLSKLSNDKERVAFLKGCRRSIIYSICEICRNIIRGNMPVSTYRRRQLAKYKDHIREISKKSITLKKRKAILNQHGGFLPSLLIPAVSILAQIAAEKLL